MKDVVRPGLSMARCIRFLLFFSSVALSSNSIVYKLTKLFPSHIFHLKLNADKKVQKSKGEKNMFHRSNWDRKSGPNY